MKIKIKECTDLKTHRCEEDINYGMILRLIITIISFAYLYIYINDKYIKKNIFAILPILLTLLDVMDGYKLHGREDCYKTYYYQIFDKIVDVISYSLLFVFLPLDTTLLFFVLYRIIGVIIFTVTRQKTSLIVFFDFVKEYLLYLFIFDKNYTYFASCIFLKILFEYTKQNMYNFY
jgi:hypothetical protein